MINNDMNEYYCKNEIKHNYDFQFTTGEDLVLQARTGSGKTLSFALPVVESLNDGKKSTRHPQVLVLTPTRELCKQVAECFESLCCHSIKVVIFKTLLCFS